MSCGAAIANAAYTGVFCDACHESEQNPPPRGIRAWMNTPTSIGAVTAALGLMFHITINGVDYAQGAAGTLAVIWAAVGALKATRAVGDARKKQLVAAGAVLLLGLFEIARAFFVVSG